MKLALALALALVALALAGCSSPYASAGLRGGYSDTHLAPDLVRVVFSGNGFISAAQVEDFALLRAADIAAAGGWSHFLVVGSEQGASTSVHHTPGVSTTQIQASQLGVHTVATAQTVTSPGASYTIRKPSATLLVRLLRDPQPGALEVAFLRRSLREKYRITDARP